MLDVKRRVLNVPVTNKMYCKMLEKLKKEYKPLMCEIKEELCRNLCIDFGDYKETVFFAPVFHQISLNDKLARGDIFISNKSKHYYLQIPIDRRAIDVTCVSRISDTDEELDRFCEIINEAVFPLVRSAVLNWKDDRPVSDKYKLLRNDMPVFTPTEEDYRAVTELESTKSRELLAKISVQPSVFLNDLGDENERMMIGGLIWKMEQLGLVSRDYILFCHQTGQQINRVESISAIEDAAQQGFKCFHCGRLISQERIDQCIRITDYGKYITRGSYWLAVRLLGLLKGAGLMGEEILVDYHEGEVDIIDLYFNCDNKLTLVEIKVNNYSMTDAYLFYNKVTIYKPDEVILISLSPVKEGIKDYFSHVIPERKILYLENLNELPKVINVFLDAKRTEYILSKLSCFTSDTYIDLAPLSVTTFFGLEKEAEEEDGIEELIKIEPEEDILPEEEPEEIGVPVMAEISSEMDEIPDMSLDSLDISDDLGEDISDTKEMVVDIEDEIADFSDTDIDDVSEEKEMMPEEEIEEGEDLEEIEMPKKPERISNMKKSVMEEPSMAEDDFSFEEAMDFLKDGLDEFSILDDINLDEDFAMEDISEEISIEEAPEEIPEEEDEVPPEEEDEVPPEEPFEMEIPDEEDEVVVEPESSDEASMDSVRELIGQEILENIVSEGILGRNVDDLKNSLSSISEMDGVLETVIASNEGLVICHTGEDTRRASILAAITVEFSRRITRAAEDLNITKPAGILVEATEGKIMSLISSDFVLSTLISEQNLDDEDKINEFMGELLVKFEEDKENNESVLRNFLEFLNETHNLTGTIIGTGEGLVVMSSLKESMPSEKWIAYLYYIYQAAEDAVSRLGLGDTERYIFKTRIDEEEENLICFKKGDFILAGMAGEGSPTGGIVLDLKAAVQSINTLLDI